MDKLVVFNIKICKIIGEKIGVANCNKVELYSQLNPGNTQTNNNFNSAETLILNEWLLSSIWIDLLMLQVH